MEETLEILQDNLGQALIDTAYMVVVSADYRRGTGHAGGIAAIFD